MTPLWWSILLAAVGILGLLLAGSKRKVGWLIGLGAQGLWVVYALVTVQYGFILSAAVYAAVYARNYILWRRDDRDIPRDVRGVPIMPAMKPPTVGPKGPAGNSGVAR